MERLLTRTHNGSSDYARCLGQQVKTAAGSRVAAQRVRAASSDYFLWPCPVVELRAWCKDAIKQLKLLLPRRIRLQKALQSFLLLLFGPGHQKHCGANGRRGNVFISSLKKGTFYSLFLRKTFFASLAGGWKFACFPGRSIATLCWMLFYSQFSVKRFQLVPVEREYCNALCAAAY